MLYAVLGYAAIKTATAGSSKSNEDSLTRKLLELPGGQLIVMAIGVVIGIVAAIHIKRGLTASFDKRLQADALTGTSGTAVKRVGQAGYVAKGVALAVLGGIFIWAGATYDADQAGGLDTALRTLLDASAGPWLLVVVAAGIIGFGVYCFAWARYADTNSSHEEGYGELWREPGEVELAHCMVGASRGRSRIQLRTAPTLRLDAAVNALMQRGHRRVPNRPRRRQVPIATDLRAGTQAPRTMRRVSRSAPPSRDRS